MTSYVASATRSMTESVGATAASTGAEVVRTAESTAATFGTRATVSSASAVLPSAPRYASSNAAGAAAASDEAVCASAIAPDVPSYASAPASSTAARYLLEMASVTATKRVAPAYSASKIA